MMAMRRTIAILLSDLRGGGAERVSIDLADALAALGHRVEFVLLRAKGEFLAEAEARHSVVSLDASRTRGAVLPLMRYVRGRSPDALVAMMWPLTSIAPVAVKLSRQRCRVLVVEHGILSGHYGAWGRLHHAVLRTSLAIGCRLADARAGVSRGVADDVAALAGLQPDSVAQLHNPIPKRPAPTQAALSGAESVWPLPRGKRILTVGNLKDDKNHALLLESFRLLQNPSTCLMIVGQGEREPSLRRHAEILGIADRVVFAGFHPDPTPFYLTADLFVLSSDYEGFGNVIVEALACGLPVVSTNCPSGPAEILDGGRCGRLTPVGDAAALARAMQEALAEPWDAEALKVRAADFLPERAALAYLEALGLP